MADDNADIKPINVIVKDQAQTEVHFKIKPSTKMGKVFDAYANKKGIAKGQLRFIFDGERVQDDQTAAELEIADGDSIDVVMEQLGGC